MHKIIFSPEEKNNLKTGKEGKHDGYNSTLAQKWCLSVPTDGGQKYSPLNDLAA